MFSSETRSNFRKRKGHRQRYFIYQDISVPIPSKPTLESSQVPTPWNIPSLGSCFFRGAPKQCFTSQARGVIVLARERAGGGTGWGKPAFQRPTPRREQSPAEPALRAGERAGLGLPTAEPRRPRRPSRSSSRGCAAARGRLAELSGGWVRLGDPRRAGFPAPLRSGLLASLCPPAPR